MEEPTSAPFRSPCDHPTLFAEDVEGVTAQGQFFLGG